MHDFFDIVGLSRSAPPVEVRRVCARLSRRAHPDFTHRGSLLPVPGMASISLSSPGRRRDVAVDFVEMSALIDVMHASFFTSDLPSSY